MSMEAARRTHPPVLRAELTRTFWYATLFETVTSDTALKSIGVAVERQNFAVDDVEPDGRTSVEHSHRDRAPLIVVDQAILDLCFGQISSSSL